MADVEKDIIFRIEADDRVSKKFNNIAETLAKLDKTSFNIGGVNWQGATKAIGEGIKKGMVPAIKAMTKETKNLSFSTQKMFSITLPLMFGFMNLGQAMKDALTPANDLLGTQQLYNTFLAERYIPIAETQLDNVLALGDAWSKETYEEQYAAGVMALTASRVSQLVAYTAQMTQIMSAFGSLLPTIHLEILGAGIEVTGQQLGTFLGITGGLSSGLWALSDEGGQAMVDFGGMMQAVGIKGSDAILGFLETLGLLKDDTDNTIPTLTTDISENTGSISGAFKIMGSAILIVLDSLSGNAGIAFAAVAKVIGEKVALIGLGIGIFATDTGATYLGNMVDALFKTGNLDTALENIRSKFATVYNWIRDIPGLGKLLPPLPTYTILPTTTSPVLSTPNPFKTKSGYTQIGTTPAGGIIVKGPTGVPQTMTPAAWAAMSYQAGGIFTRPTFGMIGETGPEAVIPLSRMGNMGSNVTIMNPVINLTSVAGRESSEQIAREVIQRIGAGLVRVGG